MEKQHLFFWRKIENELSTKIPCYVKNSLHLGGFRDAITIKYLDESKIADVERFISTELLDVISAPLNADIRLSDFFGEIYSFNPKSFKFQPGEKCQMNEIAAYVKAVVDEKSPNSGIQKFAFKLSGQNRSWITFDGTVNYKHFGRYFTSHQNSTSTEPSSIHQPLNGDSKAELFRNIKQLLESKDLTKEEIDTFNESMVSVSANGDTVSGVIVCVLCRISGNKRDQHTINAKWVNGKMYWTNSNYGKHIKEVHKRDTNKMKAADDKNTASHTEKSPVKKKKAESVSPLKTETTPKNGQTLEGSPANANHSLSLKIDPLEGFDMNNPEKLLEKLELMIYRQISNQTMKMFETAVDNDAVLHDVTFEVFDKSQDVMFEFKMQLEKIAGDGNCLFGSLGHQIFCNKLKSRKHTIEVKKLRAQAVSYINDNYESFKMDIRGSVYNDLDDDDDESNENIDAKCKIYLRDLSQNKFWAGIESLRAIAQIQKVNVLIINEDGDSYFADGFQPSFDRTVIIMFRLVCKTSRGLTNYDRNHYDSVIQIEQETQYILAKMLAPAVLNQYTFKLQTDEVIIDCDDDDNDDDDGEFETIDEETVSK